MITFNDTTNEQGLVQDLRFTSGQDSLSINDATRLLNFALDSYSDLALSADGIWKFDDSRHVDSDDDATFPRATATLSANAESIKLETAFLKLNQVAILVDGKYKVLKPIDEKDYKGSSLSTVFSTAGVPEYYDYDAHSLFVYPKSSIDRTVKILFSRAALHFEVTDTTVELGIPSIHANYLVLKAAHRLTFKSNDPNRSALRDEIIIEEKKIKEFYSKRDEDTPRRLKAKIPSVFMSNRNRR